MTRSILDVLATLPSGRQGPTLDLAELGTYLARYCNTDADKDRAKRHVLRDELYRDGGIAHMNAFIDRVFADRKVRDLRKEWVPIARIDNPIRRVVHELSTVYAVPARRMVDDPHNATYQRVLKAVRMDERMLQVSRLLNLHRALLVGFRVRVQADGVTREPVLDIATPANARAVLHPNDNTLVVGWLIRTSYRSARRTNLPAWTLWTDHESVQLTDEMRVLSDTYMTHGFGVCPWVSVTLGPPEPGFWPGCEGEDLAAAHMAVWFSNVLLLKETKSATKQTVVQGDGTTVARGQAGDSEVPLELADGQTVTTQDMSMDLEMFRATGDHVLTHVGLNYGIPPGVLMHQGVQSAEARDLQRLPIEELRQQQQVPLRLFEAGLVVVKAAVLRVDLPELWFDPSTWSMEFSSSRTPLDPVKEHELFEKRRAAGLDNTVSFYQRLRGNDITADRAWREIEANILVETERQRAMRPMEAASGALGAAAARADEKDGGKDTGEPGPAA